MSNAARKIRSIQSRPARSRPQLRVIEKVDKKRDRVSVFAILCVLIVSTFVSVIAYTASASLAFDIRSSQIELAHVNERNESLRVQLAKYSSPTYLKHRATQMGMIVWTPNQFIHINKDVISDNARSE